MSGLFHQNLGYSCQGLIVLISCVRLVLKSLLRGKCAKRVPPRKFLVVTCTKSVHIKAAIFKTNRIDK